MLFASACAQAAKPASPAPPSAALPSSIIACTGRALLPLGVPVLSSTMVGEDALRGSCVRGEAPECAFALEVPSRSELRVSLETSDFDGALALFDGGDPPSELGCVDDVPVGDTHHARIETTLSAGRYLVVVEGVGGEAGQFSLFVELDPLPSLEVACAEARPLVPGVASRGSTRGAPNQFGASCAGGAEGPDQVHELVLDKPARVRIRQRSEHDGALALRASCSTAASEIACNDDFGDDGRSFITARLEPGRYAVISDSFSRAHSGEYVLFLEREPEPPARGAQARCAAPSVVPLSAGTQEIDTLYAPSELSGSCGGQGAPEVVFALSVAEPSTLTAELEQPELNAVIYLRTQCVDPDSEIACLRAPRLDRPGKADDDAPRALVTTLMPGNYFLVVDGQVASDMGAASLRVNLVPTRERANKPAAAH